MSNILGQKVKSKLSADNATAGHAVAKFAVAVAIATVVATVVAVVVAIDTVVIVLAVAVVAVGRGCQLDSYHQ